MVEKKTRGSIEEGPSWERIGWATRLRKSGRKRGLEGALRRDRRGSVLGGLLG